METQYKILIVDDNNDLTSAIAEGIDAAGGFVSQSANTIEAAEKALLDPVSDISAVVLDVGLPDGDGRDLCERLRRKGVQVPLILLSGHTREDDVVRGLEQGADAYVRKPFLESELIARLRGMVTPRPAQHAA